MKKEGIMRINSYNKFFEKVAEIMNTTVKAVKQLDGRYKVELANHVYLNVYKGVRGSLFIHDHRGIAHITSCYDFEDFKTIKDLYERLITDFCEEDCVENAECERGNDVFDGCKQKPQKTETNKIKGHIYIDTDSVKVAPLPEQQTWERYAAINNPNWHTVRLATVNSSDFFRLNEKLKLYILTYRELKQTLSYLRKCKSINTYDSCYLRYIKKQNDMCAKGKITNAMLNYIRAKLSMQNVESGIWKSGCENATGYHDSRRYNKSRIDL